eukprot:TRINITY_DN7545_c0_g1_i1.p1 TRINITY_DN7545_c0_g1~~TRINITY_DN7545_c0_g1_i1.p1  ORF type:complete len:491 (+),score=122.63 TRINITY_DN7545_c0_g1_i1:139-1611(+)
MTMTLKPRSSVGGGRGGSTFEEATTASMVCSQLRGSQGHTEANKERDHPGPLSPKTASATRDERLQELQRSLAVAVEEHDVENLGRLLPQAQSMGVSMRELESAQKVLHYELKNALCMEMEQVRHCVLRLNDTVAEAEVRAREVMRAVESRAKTEADDRRKDGAQGGEPSRPHDAIARQLATSMWATLEGRIEAMVQGAVERHMQQWRQDARAEAEFLSVEDFLGGSDALQNGSVGQAAARQRAKSGLSRDDAATRLQAAQRGKVARTKAARRELSVHIIQRAARAWLASGRRGTCRSVKAVAEFLLRRGLAISKAYLSRSEGDGLASSGLRAALLEVQPQLAPVQCDAIWEGFRRGFDADKMSFRVFVPLCQALTCGEHWQRRAADFADLRADAFVSLGRGDGAAATKVQASWRGKKGRAKADEERRRQLISMAFRKCVEARRQTKKASLGKTREARSSAGRAGGAPAAFQMQVLGQREGVQKSPTYDF